MGKYKIFVDGSSGTTGLRIADRLAERDEFEILKISEADRKDVRARAAVINESDLSFLCLPDDAAREVVPLLRDDVRILDTSTAHRTAPGWVYGLPELHGTREALKNATRVAVPGCHATGFIAPVAPLVELGIIPKAAHLNVTSLTGYSGGGKKMIAEYEAERTNEALNAPRPYGLALHHKHLPEMAAVTGLDTAPNFVPVVADYYAGMETMIPLDVTALGVSAPQVASALAGYYAGQPMVKVHPLCEGTDGGFLAANKLAGNARLSAVNGFPLGGSCQRPRPRTDEGRPCRNNPFTGGNGGLCPHPACGHLPPRGKAFEVRYKIARGVHTMSDFKSIPGGICAPKGFSAAGVHCGIRHNHSKLDLALIKADVRCAGAGCYTTNKVYGAPITVDREHLKDGYAQAIVVNSGNANTCAPNGVQLAKDTCDIVAKELGIRADDVLPSSTGVIGQAMSIEPFARGIPEAAAKLAADEAGSHDAATAIMTTDTHPKEIALEFAVGGKAVRIGAIAKGSGMIHPNMATMLLFMTTDAKVAPAALQKALSTVVPATFNQISVDGDTSTNDTVLLLASGLSGAEIAEGTPDYDTFVAALTEVAEHLSRELAGDGEGATKLLECTVTGAPDLATARAVSKSVIHSTLFKAAMFGADANWGRVLCAIGYTPGDFDISKTSVRLKSKAGEVFVCENAAYHPYSEDEAAVVLKEDEIDILVDLGSGDATAKAWGCDLTYDYVKINGDYRT